MFKSKFFFIILFSLVILILSYLRIWPKIGLFSLRYCNKCNIVIFDIDVLRYDTFDCKSNTTPRLCKFFKNSVYFENNISHTDNTRPSFISFMTSLYPSSHKVWSLYAKQLDPKISTFPQVLKQNGYKTIIATRFQNQQLNYNWFDQVINYQQINKTLQDLNRKRQPFFLYIYNADLHFPYLSVPAYDQDAVPQGLPKDNTELYQKQMEYISKNLDKVFKPEAFKDYPEILNKNNLDKEKIYQLFEKMANDTVLNQYLYDVWDVTYQTLTAKLDPHNPKHITYLKNQYLANLRHVDQIYSDVLTNLESNKFQTNTITMLRSDHGEEFYEHGSCCHQNNLYQELIHTPLVIKLPHHDIQHINGLSQDIDLMPTLLQLIDIPIPTQVQGKNLVPLMQKKTINVNDYQIAQKGDGWVAAFRKKGYKLILLNSKPSELYNLATDPKEHNNLLLTPTGKKTASFLLDDYSKIINNLPVYQNIYPVYPGWMDEQKKQKLRQEGYF